MKNSSENIRQAYSEAVDMSKNHYENFPVISFLIPRKKRNDVAVIYKFARMADDIADEGYEDPDIRTKKLEAFEDYLLRAVNGDYESVFWEALSKSVHNLSLSPENLFNLLKAFKQDVVKKRYENYESLQDYCRLSANPVGRLILEVFGIRDNSAFGLSDKICTGLQIANFIQDVSLDIKKGRIYLPQEDIKRFGVAENQFQGNLATPNFKELIKNECTRTKKLFDEGEALLGYLSGRLKIEIKWTINGGREILKKIEKSDYDVLNNRPVITKIEFAGLLLKSLF